MSHRSDDGSARRTGAEHVVELEGEITRLRELLARERGLREAVLMHSPHGVIISDASGKLVAQNPAAEKIWAGRATADDIAGWGQYRAFHPDGRPYEAGDWSMARALSSGEIVEAEEVHFQRFDDTHGVLLGSCAPIYDPAGDLEGALSIFVDITESKRQEEQIRVGAEQYYTTLRSIGDAVISTDHHGDIVFLNPVAEALTGWTLADARGEPVAGVFHIVNECTRETVESPVDKVIQEGQIVGLANHTILIARDGSEVCIDDSGAPIFSSTGELVGVVLVFRDVTEKRREETRRAFIAEASAELVSNLDYSETLARVASLATQDLADWCAVDMLMADGSLNRLAVSHIDPERVQLAHDLAERYPPDPTSPYGAHEVSRTGKSLLMSEIPEEVLLAGAVDEEHLQIIKDLALRSAMLVALRCRGRMLGVLTFVSSDPLRRFTETDLALAEELANVAALAVDNARLFREAQQANQAKDEFLTTVSHELRTPLNAILGWASLLRSTAVSDEKRAHGVETIERNARAQAQLIDDLLDMARIIAGNLKLEIRSLNLGKVVRAALESVQLAAEAKGIRIELLIDDESSQASGDTARLQQVVWNLLSNAVKFTDRGGCVRVHLRRYESQAELVVTDTGRGIDPAFLPHLFERFQQENATSTRTQGGLGIGLAIVKHLVELHGGTVHAESEGVGHGSSFYVRLPLSAVVRRQEVVTPSSSKSVAPRLDGLRILVVDDEKDARELLTEILHGHGAEVTAVSSAAEALVEVLERLPDILVSDIGMPEEDGYSLMRKVRTLLAGEGAALPAVALTAYARSEDRTRALLAGFQAHVAKPVEIEELIIVIATLAGRTSREWLE